MTKPIPEVVATRVLNALKALREINERVASYVAVDTRFGGDGRYEAEAFLNTADERNAALAVINQFNELAPKNGIDAEQQLKAWGGVQAGQLTMRGRLYLVDMERAA